MTKTILWHSVISRPLERVAGKYISRCVWPGGTRAHVVEALSHTAFLPVHPKINSTVFSLPQGKLLSYFGLVPHGHMLDLPNAMYGAIFYLQQLVWGRMPLLVVGAFVTSVYLAYQLTFVLGDLCILCWSTHVINTTLFAYAVLLPLLSKFRSPSKQGHKVSKQA